MKILKIELFIKMKNIENLINNIMFRKRKFIK